MEAVAQRAPHDIGAPPRGAASGAGGLVDGGGGSGSAAGDPQPPLRSVGNAALRRLYSGAKLVPLYERLGVDLSELSSEAAALARSAVVVRADGGGAPLSGAGRNRHAGEGTSTGAPLTPAAWSRVIAESASACARSRASNVLSLGVRSKRGRAAALPTEVVYPNTSTNSLLTRDWCELVAVAGEAAARELLASGDALFMRLPNSNYMQLAGVPAVERGKRVMREAARRKARTTGGVAQPDGSREQHVQCASRRAEQHQRPQQRHSQPCKRSESGPAGVAAGTHQPPSQAPASGSQARQGDGASEPPVAATTGPRPRVPAPGGSVGLGSTPAAALVPRNFLFCAYFGRTPGLPTNHVLLRVQAHEGGAGAGRRLYTAIFVNPPPTLANTGSRPHAGSSSGGTHSSSNRGWPEMIPAGGYLPMLPQRVPRAHRGAPAALAALARGAAACPCARLLRSHCPLPQCLERGRAQQKRRPQPQRSQQEGASDGSRRREPSGAMATQQAGCAPAPAARSGEVEFDTQEPDVCGGGAGAPSGVHSHSHSQLTSEVNALAAAQTSPRAVASFVWACLLHMAGPSGLLGPKGSPTRRSLRQRVEWFIRLRRFEQCSVHQLMQGVRPADMPFVTTAPHGEASARVPPQQAAARQRMTERWVLWLFACMVSPLVRAHFYATDGEATRQSVVFYRKPVWARLAVLAERQLARRGWMVPLVGAGGGDVHGPGSEKGGAEADAGVASPPACTVARCAHTLAGRQLGFADLRLLPRARGKGVRPLLNMGRSHAITTLARAAAGPTSGRAGGTHLRFQAVNAALRPAFHVLKHETRRAGGGTGASVFHPNELHVRLRAFLATNARAPGVPLGASGGVLPPHARPRMYIVAADISKAFDTVDRPRLLRALEDTFSEGEYLTVRYSAVRPNHLNGSVRCTWECAVRAAADYPQFADVAAGLASTKLWHSVLTDQVVYSTLERPYVLSLVQEHIAGGVVCVGGCGRHGRLYRHAAGIAQGSVLSSLLCSLHYATMERETRVPGIGCDWAASGAGPVAGTQASVEAGGPAAAETHRQQQQRHKHGGAGQQQSATQSMLVRMIDDFLFVSTSAREGCEFLSCAATRFPAYGAGLNVAKTRLNWDARIPGEVGGESSRRREAERVPAHVIRDGTGESFVPWCGLLLASRGLEVRADYFRLSVAGLMGSVNASVERAPGAQLRSKLLRWVRERLKPVLLDPAINARRTVALNLYQGMLMVALKLRVYGASLRRAGGHCGARLTSELAEGAWRFARLVCAREARARRDSFGAHASGWVPRAAEVHALCAAAFARAFCVNRPAGLPEATAAAAALRRAQARAERAIEAAVVRGGDEAQAALRRLHYATDARRSSPLEAVLAGLPSTV